MRVLNLTGGISANAAKQTARKLEYYFPGHDITCGIFESKNPEFESIANDRGLETRFFGQSVTDRFKSISLLPGKGYVRSTGHALKHATYFDLIHVYGGPLFHGPIGAIHALLSRAPLVIRFNGYVPVPKSPAKRALVSGIIQGLLRSTRVVFNSQAQKADTLLAYGAKDGDHINVIPPGVDRRWFDPIEETDHLAAELGINKDMSIVGSVITPRPVKRLDRAFEIISRVRKNRDLAYVILGESEYLDQYKRLAEEMGVGDIVYWVGHKGEQELAEWYSLFDATILTSEWESFGMSITESYLCGTPCVAFDVGGMSDQIIDGKTGWLVEPFDLDAFAKALEQALEENRLKEFGVQGQEYVSERFTLKSASNQYSKMITEISQA